MKSIRNNVLSIKYGKKTNVFVGQKVGQIEFLFHDCYQKWEEF